MTNERMTIHKALAELKLMDSRIEKVISEGIFCIANKHSNTKINGVNIDEFIKSMKGSYDKANDLIIRRNAIKRAVVLSNAVTTVRVNEVTYTIAEAIEMKNHGITFKEMLLEDLCSQYNDAQLVALDNNGKRLEERAEKYVVGMFGSKEGKTNVDDFDKAMEDFITANTYEIIDPLKITDKINSLESEISEFKAEIDSALSVSNAITEIEISY